MKSFLFLPVHDSQTRRKGSTLVIVIALLGLLSFIGMVFFTFASQERAASEYFSDAAKAQIPNDHNIFDWGLRHVLIGPTAQERNSILYSPTQRHSMVKGVFGSDIHPHTGAGVEVIYNANVPIANSLFAPLPHDGDSNINDVENQLDMVDSPLAWGLQVNQQIANNELARLFRYRGYENIMPEPDVDYTSPDINTMFIAYRGWAIRDNREDLNGNGSLDPGEVDRNGNMMADPVSPEFEMVPVTIPSFFRPQYMKRSGGPNRFGHYVPTDPDWLTTNPANTTYAARSFRPHPSHKTRNFDTNAVLPRYLDAATASALSPPVLSGGFEFVPADSSHSNQDPSLQGELGIFTGSHPSVIELDVDNDQFVEPDGNPTNEGIWLDLDFPIQEMIDGSGNTRTYVVLHSFTIYDLDSLINTNVHGNLAGLDRSGELTALVSSGAFANQMLSKSNLGLGPNEVNPTYALRRDERADNSTLNSGTYVAAIPTGAVPIQEQFIQHFGRPPENAIEQANMELVWLLTGRADFDSSNQIKDVFPGRWGDVRSLYTTLSTGTKNVSRYPRPGRGDNQDVLASSGSGTRFGGDSVSSGRGGYDDNQDRYEGEAVTALGKYRPFGHPTDFAGTGQTTTNSVNGYAGARGLTAVNGGGNPLIPDLLHMNPLNPSSWLRYTRYSMTREVAPVTGSVDPFRAYSRYIFGTNMIFDGAAEQLMRNPFFDPLFEDPLEQIFDPNFAQRPQDNAFGPQDTLVLQMALADVTASVEKPSSRLPELAPFALDPSNRNREMLTTFSNSYRYVPFLHPFGSDGRPGKRGDDDDNDGLTDEPDEILSSNNKDVTDISSRWWEFTADSDGADRLDNLGNPGSDGFPDGDGNREFPPEFGKTLELGKPYGPHDPFRAQVRRILTVEAGERQGLIGQLPLSINHLLDVDRKPQTNLPTPSEGSKEFLYFMQRSGLKFRSLTEHPSAHTDGDGDAALDMRSTDLPRYEPATNPTDRLPAYPPQTIAHREFWARRDRQQMARDIYVLLYTLGGARRSTAGNIADYRRANNPNLAEDAAPTGPTDPSDALYFTTEQPLYTHRQLRRMAQFAVNLVDAMDTDNIVTKFEYDKNFGPNIDDNTGGWELDDNPYTHTDDVNATAPDPTTTENMLYPEDTDGRGVVYGVEAQQLALSEILAIRSKAITMGGNTNATQYTDDRDRDFLFVELQNMLPMELDLATDRSLSTNPQKGIWRLVRNDRTAVDHPLVDANDASIVIADHAENVVDGGGRFSISVASDTGLTASAFFVDLGDVATNMFDGVYELIAPDVTTITDSSSAGAADPLTDIDVLHTNHIGRFVLENGPFLDDPATVVAPAGNYLGNETFEEISPNRFTATSNPGFDLVLQRRMNPDLPSLDLAENPWIEVDRRKVEFADFQLTNTGGPVEVYNPDTMGMPPMPSGRILEIPSHERLEPLQPITNDSIAKTVTPHRRNTIKGSELATKNDLLGVNSGKISDPLRHVSATNVAAAFNVWQPHFDRDFASSIDLLNLPAFGPQTLTQQLQISRLAPFQQVGGNPAQAIRLSSAAGLFLMPDFPDLTPAVPGSPAERTNFARDNRWYRMLQFVEVPSRVHRMLGNYLTLNRMPGKINLNMIRHREVYAGLIDSPFLMDVPDTSDTTAFFTGAPPDLGNKFEDGPFTNPATGSGPDGWQDFLTERDGIINSFDPGVPTRSLPGRCRYLIPGMPNSNPFRTLASQDEFNPNPLQSTMLRTLKADFVDVDVSNALIRDSNRHWLEIGDLAEHRGPNSPRTTTQQKYQLLSKIQNNTTTVSNTFVVFATAGFFEAFEHTTGANAGLVQVGGPLDMDGDSQTTDDRKRAVFLIDRTEALNAFDPGTGGFDWSKLVKARLNIVE